MAFHHIKHPLIEHELGRLRAKNCPPQMFREALRRVGLLMAAQVTQGFALSPREVETPLESMSCQCLQTPIVLVPILRAGLGFVDGFLEVMPEASVAHIGVKRDHCTLQPVTYYANFPGCMSESEVIVLDPMLATGGSAIEAVRMLYAAGAKRVRFVCLVAAPEGVECFKNAWPEVDVYTAALDRGLNADGYIMPGLGDAGDRLFGT